MPKPHRIVWGEGMMLTPQHFQQWDRHQFHQRSALSQACAAYPWGVLALQLDESSLSSGEVVVQEFRAVLGSGLFVDAPHSDPLPDRRSFPKETLAKAGRLGVFVGVPHVSGSGLEFSVDGKVKTPYGIETLEVSDAVRIGQDRELEVGVVQLRVLFDDDALDDYERIQIGEVRTNEKGSYVFDPTFVPPLLSVAASPHLSRVLRRVLEMASTKSEELAGQQRKSGGFAEAVSFWLLHTVNSYLPLLAHYHREAQVHPEQLYVLLAQFAGELCTFTSGQHPRHLPAYRHEELGACFTALDEKLRELLGEVAPTRCIPVPLEQRSETLFEASIAEDELLENAQFFLAIGADKPADWIATEGIKQVRLSSAERLPLLIQYAIPGLTLHHVSNPPADIPIQQGRVYFRLEKAGEHWDAIAGAHGLQCHIPPTFPSLRVELMAVKES